MKPALALLLLTLTVVPSHAAPRNCRARATARGEQCCTTPIRTHTHRAAASLLANDLDAKNNLVITAFAVPVAVPVAPPVPVPVVPPVLLPPSGVSMCVDPPFAKSTPPTTPPQPVASSRANAPREIRIRVLPGKTTRAGVIGRTRSRP